MHHRESPVQGAQSHDPLDDLFNDRNEIDEAFRDTNNTGNNPNSNRDRRARGNDDSAAGLGIDEEIKVRKRRQVAKLDEERYAALHPEDVGTVPLPMLTAPVYSRPLDSLSYEGYQRKSSSSEVKDTR